MNSILRERGGQLIENTYRRRKEKRWFVKKSCNRIDF